MIAGSLTIMHFIILGFLIFTIGVTGILINRKSVISILMSIEIMLLAVNINFVAISSYLHDITGQIFTIMILTVAAAEAAIGLAILVVYFRSKQNIDIEHISQMRG